MTLPWIVGSAVAGVLELTHLGMPDFRPRVGRSSGAAGGP
jgi:hypothetical protein